MKYLKYLLFLILLIPFNLVEGSGTYKVVVISSTGLAETIATYSNYNDALSEMNNYDSTEDMVASIYKNNTLVNTKYGLFVPNTTGTITFDTDYGSRYVSGSYNSEWLFLGYDDTNNQALIKVSGVTGYVSLAYGTVEPISCINCTYDSSSDVDYVKVVATSSLRLRESPGLSSTQLTSISNGAIVEWLNKGELTIVDGYEWYQVSYNGYTGYIANDLNDDWVIEYVPSSTTSREIGTYYYNYSKTGNLIHEYYATASGADIWFTNLGISPEWLETGIDYYSFDGNYFYESFTQMVDDHYLNTFDNAVNALPYYNYYQYLPSRTQTIYSADNINQYLSAKYVSKINRDDYFSECTTNETGWCSTGSSFPSNQSMLYGEGETFIYTQETYGVNAAQTFALAVNESGWGRSTYSVSQYNLFGHNAVDSNPDLATGYGSVADGIITHATDYIVASYSNPISGANYNGSQYGNKLSGNNVKYASDAYWGEKMAGQYFFLDNYFGLQEFKTAVTTGIKTSDAAVAVKSEPNSSSTTYYNLKAIPDITVSILDTVIGEEINGSNVWYKIQSDVSLDENRNISSNLTNYDYDLSYAYIHSSYVYVESDAPVIFAEDVVLNIGDTYSQEVYAFDAWEGYKAVTQSGTIDTSTAGTYNVTYSSTDSDSNTTTKTITVTVIGDTTEAVIEVDAQYYLDSITEDFKVLGFITMSGIDNSLSNNITYSLEFINNTTDEVIVKTLNRITDSSQMPFLVGSDYSWFDGTVDLSTLPVGDYTVYLKAESGIYYSVVPFSNVFSKSMPTTVEYENKYVTLRSNYETNESPIEVFVREEKIADKTTSSNYNLITEYTTINFDDNNLVINGAAHSVGADLSSSTDVTRYMYFEEINSFKTYNFDIGSTTNGLYEIQLRVSDGYDKTRAWFETSIDVSDIEIGTYSIYVSNDSNVSDYGELQDIFSRNIAATTTIDGKTYTLKVDTENRYRILLIVT
ncbi:MAG: SH3 domain-containing protein [Mycoplasmatota bacterium]